MKYITEQHVILIAVILQLVACFDSNMAIDDASNNDDEIEETTSNDYNPSSSVISNDMWWTDQNGENISASFGGHITQIEDTYYWIGNNPNASIDGPDIHLYSSRTLGSNSWKHEGKVVDFTPGEDGDKNCTLLYSELTGNFIIVAKGLKFYESSKVTGPYVLKNSISKFQIDQRKGKYKIGGMGTYQEGDQAYIITSRRWLDDATETQPLNHRYTGIYKLTPDFLSIEKEICWLRNDSREAMWIFKKDNTYYMTASHTAGWTASNCYYRTSSDLIHWSEEKEIGMTPTRPGGTQEQKIMRSHGTQQRWIIKVGEQWMYGGDRYPYQESESHPFEKGLYLMCPVEWDHEKPIVTYKKTWSILE